MSLFVWPLICFAGLLSKWSWFWFLCLIVRSFVHFSSFPAVISSFTCSYFLSPFSSSVYHPSPHIPFLRLCPFILSPPSSHPLHISPFLSSISSPPSSTCVCLPIHLQQSASISISYPLSSSSYYSRHPSTSSPSSSSSSSPLCSSYLPPMLLLPFNSLNPPSLLPLLFLLLLSLRPPLNLPSSSFPSSYPPLPPQPLA